MINANSTSPSTYAYTWSCPWSGCPRTFLTSSELLFHNKEIHQSPLQEAYLSLAFLTQREDVFAPPSFQSTNSKNKNSQICTVSGCEASLETKFDLAIHYEKIHGIVLASSTVSHCIAAHEVLSTKTRNNSSAPNSGQIFGNAAFACANSEGQAKPDFDQVFQNTEIPSANIKDQRQSSTAGRSRSKNRRTRCTKLRLDTGAICVQTFTRPWDLKRHQNSRAHSPNVQQYTCGKVRLNTGAICVQTFTRPWDLKRHQNSRAHSPNVQQYTCGKVRLNTGAICVETFTTPENLKIHQNGQAHNPNMQQYTCGKVRVDTGVICIETFTRSESLKKHQNGQAHNPNVQRYTCGKVRLNTGAICVETFTRPADLKNHQNNQAHNPNVQRYTYDLCNAVYVNKYKLLIHKEGWHCESQI